MKILKSWYNSGQEYPQCFVFVPNCGTMDGVSVPRDNKQTYVVHNHIIYKCFLLNEVLGGADEEGSFEDVRFLDSDIVENFQMPIPELIKVAAQALRNIRKIAQQLPTVDLPHEWPEKRITSLIEDLWEMRDTGVELNPLIVMDLCWAAHVTSLFLDNKEHQLEALKQ